MNKILLFIFDNMADFEISFITHLLGSDAGKEIIPIAFEDKDIKTSSGLIYKPKMLVKDALRINAEGVIIPGGWNKEIRPELIDLIKELNIRKKLVAAICVGSIVLAKSGVLIDKNYTTSAIQWTKNHQKFFGESDPFPRENFIDSRVVVDSNIITAEGIAFIDFAIEICDWFNLFENVDDKKLFIDTICHMAKS